jgi:hypothetical protein
MLLIASCNTTSYQVNDDDNKIFEKALQNAVLANEGFIRCENYMEAWLAEADPETKLVPRRLYGPDKDIWNAQDCAADNYPFLVLTSFFTNQGLYNGLMREMLDNEIRLTSRVNSMPDTYSFSRKGFLHDSVSMDRVIFGTSEYIKDGLIPVTEWLGQSPWSERLLTMLSDMDEYVNVADEFAKEGFGNSPVAEVNGEILQVLSRMYWMTGEQKYLEWATQIADHFLLGAGYPLRGFDYLKLRDHGCELVAGLCEFYVTLHYADKEKQRAYKEPLHDLLDYILAHGRNQDGLFYNAINPKTGAIVDQQLADTWGYTLNGFYNVYMLDSVAAYRDAVTTIFRNLDKYHNYNWENNGADGYADAIEGALNLFNRVGEDQAEQWIDAEIQVMWSMQDSSHRANAQQWRNSGIIEGWYGDGNFARTTMMYNLWKSKGTYLQPWSRDVKLGAEMKGDSLYITIQSRSAWDGKLHFDKARHTTQMKLPIDWPRINQFPEWYTVSPESNYQVLEIRGDMQSEEGSTLIDGLPITLRPNETRRFIVLVE